MTDNVVTLGIKTVMDISDVKANVGVLQSQFNKLKLPAGITDKFNQEISKFSATYEKYQQKMAQGIKTKGDATQTSKYLNEIAKEYDNIVKTYSKAAGMDLKSMFKIDSGPLKEAAAEVEKFTKQLSNVDIDKTGFQKLGQQLTGILKNSKFSGEHGLINEMIGSFDRGEVDKAKQALQEIQKEVEKRKYDTITKTDEAGNTVTMQKPGTYSEANTTAMTSLLQQMMSMADQAGIKIQDIQNPLNQASKRFDELLSKGVNSFKSVGAAAEKERAGVHSVVEEQKNLNNAMASAHQESEMISNRIAMYFSMYEIMRKIGDVAKQAFATVKELDAAMTQTAVVTNFDVSDMWGMLPQYTATANQLGSTIKDVYEATTLYYQQGLNSNQAMGVATETLKMARIAGIEAAEATDMMTAALRGFNMQVNEVSAQRINDVYSELAAITASDTEELGSAMTRTASIASSAGMEFETTSAFLAQMIETTREAPENLGTAMKTIVARFQEMKKSPTDLIDSEGEMLSANRVETALQTIGVALRDSQGEFRNLDQVFLEISSKWDTLSMGQQRYIATMAAGSRQQSRFIAMMSNYDRTMELVEAANTSAGASQEQFNKTLESMDTKLNKLKNAWDQFAMGLANAGVLKVAVDGLTGGLTIINQFIDAIGKISPAPFAELNKSIVTLVGTLGTLKLGSSLFFKNKDLFGGLVEAGSRFFKGEKGIGDVIGQAFSANVQQQQEQGANAADSFYFGLQEKLVQNGGKLKNTLTQLMSQASAAAANGQTFDQILSMDGINPQEKGRALIEALRQGIANSSGLTDEMRVQAERGLRALEEKFNQGKINIQQLGQKGKGLIEHFKLDEGVTKAEQFGNAITRAGGQVQRFGYFLKGTPLEPFGNLLVKIGTAMSFIGTSITMVTKKLAASTAAWVAETVAIEANRQAKLRNGGDGTNSLLSNKQIGQLKQLAKDPQASFSKLFQILFKGQTITKGLSIVFHALGTAIGSVAALLIKFAIPLMAIASIYTVLTYQSKTMDKLRDRAAQASDALSDLKQQASEVKDSLEQLDEFDNAFESLVEGTTEFNDKLIESNSLILDLLHKYPMLKKYTTTDANGRMQISQEGRDELQNQIRTQQAKANALSLMTAQDVANNQSGPGTYLEELHKAEQKLRDINKKFLGAGEEVGQSYTYYANTSHAKTNTKALKEMESKALKTPEQVMEEQQQEVLSTYQDAISAMFTASNTNELFNKDELTKIAGSNFEQIVQSQAADTGKDLAETYAKFYGMEYVSGNKFTKNGEEVEIDKSIWSDELTNKRIKALNNIDENAKTADSTMIHLDSTIKDTFSGLESDTLISDILSSDITANTNDLEKLIANADFSTLGEELGKHLSEEEKAALEALGIEDLSAVLEERANAILEAQQQQDQQLSEMIAQSTTKFNLGKITQINAGDQLNSQVNAGANALIASASQALAKLDRAERDFLTTTGQGLKDSFGGEAMSSLINGYLKGSDETKKALKEATMGVDWGEPIDALGAMTNMLDSTDKKVQQLGTSMRQSTKGSQLLNDAMQDVLSSEDFIKATENMDNFVDSTGHLDASGVRKMAEESGTLSKMLDTGAMSAGGLAVALNATEIDGTASIEDLSSSLLELIGHFGQLEDSVASAHDYISNFDAGIDNGESEDFIAENVKKANEFAENNEWGNDQFHNYVKSVIGEDAWQKALNSVDGDYEKAFNKIKGKLNSFADGYDTTFENLSKGLTSTGKQIDEKVLKEFEGVVSKNENGEIQIELEDGTSIEDLKKFFQKVEGIGPEQADMMIQNWRNYSPEFDAQARKADFYSGLKNSSFIENREQNGNIILTQSELDTLKSILPNMKEKDILSEIQKYAGKNQTVSREAFNNKDEEGNLRTDFADMAKEFNETIKTNFVTQKQFDNGQGGIDVDKVISGYSNAGFSEYQAQGMTFEQMKANKLETFTHNGQEIDLTSINTADEFIQKLAELDQNDQWFNVGQQIADGVLSIAKGQEKQQNYEGNYSGIGINGQEQSRIDSYKETINTAMSNTNVSEGAGQLSQIRQELDLSGQAATALADQFVQLNATSLSQLNDDELKEVWNNLYGAEQSIDTIREKIGSHPFTFDVIANDEQLNQFANKVRDITGEKRRKILLDAELTNEEKVQQFLTSLTNEFGGKSEKKKKIILEATAKFASGDKEGGQNLLKENGFNTDEIQQIEANVGVIANGSIANKEQFQSGIESAANELTKGVKVDDIDIKVTTSYETKGKKPKTAKDQKATITYTAADKVQNEPGNLDKKIFYTADKKIKNEPGNLNKTVHYSADVDSVGDQYATVHLSIAESSKKFKVVPAAKGMNQNYRIDSLPNFNSFASGTQKPKHIADGRVGPKDNGGLTLTGELGYEVAWLPSQGRSMIVGADGPQMLNLPSDAVVWNHEQSKEILKRKSLPIGSEAKGTIAAGSLGGTKSTRKKKTKTNPKQEKEDKKPKKPKKDKKDTKSSGNDSKTKKLIAQWTKWSEKVGKISNWWENITRKVEAIQRRVDKTQKKFEKELNTVGKTFSDINKIGNKYSTYLNTSIKVNQTIVDKYTKQLQQFDTKGGNKTKINKYNTTAEKASRLKAAIDAAGSGNKVKYNGKTISVKSAKTKLKNLNKTAKKQKKQATSPDGVQNVSWEETAIVKTKQKGKKTKKKKQKVKRNAAIDFSKIVHWDEETGAYVADTNAINKAAKIKKGKNKGKVNKKQAKAIKEQANKYIDTATQRMNNAQDKIDAAREALNKLADDTYNMFNRWEKSLTNVYLISQKLESLQKKADIYDTQEEYLSTKALAGYNPFSQESLDKLNTVLTNRQNGLIEQAKAQKDLVDATYEQYADAFKLNTYLTNSEIGNKAGGESQSGVNEQEAALIAFQLLKKAGAEDINTYDSVKVQKAYDEYTKGRYTNKTDEEVKKILDRIAEYQGSYYDALKESYTSVTEIYKTLNEYEEYINDFEESLLKGLEEEINKEIDKQEKLNSALTNAFKDLLDEVKRRLDQRRQTEDNAKTESDIAKKQQRLATLQADTSGGHASEIKQLQQEIAEAQQNYGRTLEDQLLERLQQQGDEAEKQRERQIKLLEIHRDLAEALGTNLEEVKEWLQNPSGNKEKIKQAWLANQNYDEALPEQQKTLENQFEEAWTKYLAYGARAQDLRDFLDEVNFDNTPQKQAAQSLQTIETDLGGLKQTIEDEVKKRQASEGEKTHDYINNVEEPGIDYGSITDLRNANIGVKEALKTATQLGLGETYSDMRKGGYTAEDFKKDNVSVVEAAKAGFTYDQLIKGGYTYNDILKEASAIAQFNSNMVKTARNAEIAKAQKQQKAAFVAQIKSMAAQIDPNNPTGKVKDKNGTISQIISSTPGINSSLKQLKGMSIPMKTGTGHINSNGLLYFNDKKGNVRRFNFETGKAGTVKYDKKTYEKHAGYKQESDTPYIKSEFQQALKKRFPKAGYKFAQGGLATATGPAWLDGTRAKPELVLNATDTKNFIALKDILSSVMNGVNSMTDVSDVQSAPVTYDININVDHLNNDYDVDRVADRVKKIIVQDASYRNVTAVRKFR